MIYRNGFHIKLYVLIIGIMLPKSLLAQEIEAFEKLIKMPKHKNIDSAATRYINEFNNTNALLYQIANISFQESQFGFVELKNQCTDKITRPFYVYIPTSYNHKRATPLLIYLHGIVSKSQLIENPLEVIKKNEFIKDAENKGFIMLFPLGQKNCTWWDSNGISNLFEQIRFVKSNYNIDDDKVFLTGYSDGASGAYLMAFAYPTTFASFIPYNGSPSVGARQYKILSFFENLSNRHLYVINTDLDRLYPDKSIHPVVELAKLAGAKIDYHVFEGYGHEFNYAEKALPLIWNFIENQKRVLPNKIIWKTTNASIGKCDWIAIDKILPKNYTESYIDMQKKTVGKIIANYANNTFEIIQTNVDCFSVSIHPEMVDTSKNVIIKVNHSIVFDNKVYPDNQFILSNFLRTRDRKRIYLNKISIKTNN